MLKYFNDDEGISPRVREPKVRLTDKCDLFCDSTSDEPSKTMIDEYSQKYRWNCGENGFFGCWFSSKEQFQNNISDVNIQRAGYGSIIVSRSWNYINPRLVKPFFLNGWFKRHFINTIPLSKWFT